MYLLGIKNTFCSDGKNEKGYANPINIIKASVDKRDILDKIRQLIYNGYEVKDIMVLEEVPYGVNISVS